MGQCHLDYRGDSSLADCCMWVLVQRAEYLTVNQKTRVQIPALTHRLRAGRSVVGRKSPKLTTGVRFSLGPP